MLEKSPESSLDSKEVQPVHPIVNQSWIFIGRNDVEAVNPILWPPVVKNCLTGKDPDAGIDWGWEEKGKTGWDGWMASPTQWTWVWLNLGVGDGQGGLACCNPWGHKESDTTERLNWTGGSDGKESVCNAGDLDSIPGSGRSPGEGNGYPLKYSCLENPMDRGA